MVKQRRRTRKVKILMGGLLAGVPLSFDSPDSALISKADYDPETEVATVTMLGQVYRYSFPPEVWVAFESATSKGSYFNANINRIFKGVRV
jgi:hypothetical protein